MLHTHDTLPQRCFLTATISQADNGQPFQSLIAMILHLASVSLLRYPIDTAMARIPTQITDAIPPRQDKKVFKT